MASNRAESCLTGGRGATDRWESGVSACIRSLYYVYI